MANNININVGANTGNANSQIINLTQNINNLNNASSTGSSLLSGFGLSLGGAAAAITAFGVASVKASNDASRSLRILKSDAQEAGVGLDEARKDAKKFGEDLSIANADAEKSYAQFLRVLKAGGEVKNADKFQEDITDLIAAYGIAGKEVEILFGQILSGQDEALNRLGLADPSKIYEAYAKKIGKTVEALSQEEKTRSILIALQEKGARFEGAAEQALNSQAGLWAQLSKTIADATANLGDFLQKQTVVGDMPVFLKALLSGQNPITAYQKFLDDRAKAQNDAARIKAEQDSDAYFKRMNNSLGVPQALGNPYGSFKNLTTMVGEEQAKKIRDGFIAQYETLFKDKRLDKITAIFAEKQFNEIKGILDPKKAAEIQAQFTQFWDKFARVALGALKTARDASGKFFDSVAERNQSGNPFVKVIQDANQRAEELRKTFGVLGTSAVKDLQKIENSFTRQIKLALELDTQLQAAALRREADALKNRTGLTGNQERALGVYDARIAAATDAPGLLAIADALGRGAVKTETTGEGKKKETRILGLDVNQDNVAREQINNLRDLENFGIREGAEFGKQARSSLNQAMVNLFNGLSPELQASIARGQEGQGVLNSFRAAFTGAAEALQDKIKDEIAKQAVADKALAGVKEDIAIIDRLRKEGLSTKEADTRLLAVTGALDPKELDAQTTQARIEALTREAERKAKAQEDAEKEVADQKKREEKLTKSIDDLAAALRKPENRRLLIEINNRAKATVRDELYGSLQED